MTADNSPDLAHAASGMLPVKTGASSNKSKTSSSAQITKAHVKALKATGSKEAFLWDATVAGLGLRAYPSGKKVWLLQYRDAHGRTRRMGLGDANAISPDDAREGARRMLAGKTLGDDPALAREKAKRATTFKELAERYLAHQEGRLRAGTLDQSKRNLNKYAAPLHPKPIEAIDRATISSLRNNLTPSAGPVQANRVLATLSAAFKWGMYEGLCENNPAALVPKNAESARERVLGDVELAAIWRATAGGDDYSHIVRLLMLTGCRREEIAGLKWSEVEGTRLVLPPARTKTKVVHEVPLADLALAQLPQRPDDNPREFVFGKLDTGYSGWTRSKERLDALVRKELGEAGEKMPGWSLHDLRRTVATRLHGAGVAPHIVEAVLAHAGAKAGIAGVYNRADYSQPKREALELWARMVAALMGEPQHNGTIIPLRKPAAG